MNGEYLSQSHAYVSTYSKDSPEPKSTLTKIMSSTDLAESNLTALSQQVSMTFKEYWINVKKPRHLDIQKCKKNQKVYHQNKDKLIQNILESLQNKIELGVLFYVVHQIWIPYIFQKIVIQFAVQDKNWITSLVFDFSQMVEIIIEILLEYYPKHLMHTEEIQRKIFSILVEYLTQHKKWIKINELLLKIMSRNKIKLIVNENTTTEVLDISLKKIVNYTFQQEISLLKEIYSSPSMKVKVNKLNYLHTIINQKFSDQDSKQVLQYCIMKTQFDGFSQLFLYILLMNHLKQKDQYFIQRLKIISDNLQSRDSTGFTNHGLQNQLNQNVLSRDSWKFIYNQRSNFEFNNHVNVSHNESCWQTIMSWNYLKSDCQVPISVDVKYNFIRFGIISECNNIDDCRDYSHFDKTVFYCISSGQLHKYNQISKIKSFKKSNVTGITLKIKNNIISWSVKDNNGITQTASCQLQQQQIQKSRVIIIFRKGKIEIFPKNL